MQIKELEVRSSAGRRSFNEDMVLHLESVPLLAVADGMGGRGVGEVAADMAMSCLKTNAPFLAAEARKVEGDRQSRSRLHLSRLLESSFKWAHQEIGRVARETGRRRMATTLLSAVIAGDHAYLAHVGNCRAYLLRGGRLQQLTQDHTVAAARQGFRSATVPAAHSEERRLLQIVGAGSIDVDLAEVPLADDDVLLLCSDGLSHPLEEATLQALVDPRALSASADALLAAAVEGGDDNITLVLARVGAARDHASAEELARVLRSVFLFRELDGVERYILAPYLEERRYPAGTPLVVEGELGSEFFVLIQGMVRITRGNVQLIDVGPGGHFGELTLAQPSPRSATVTALTPVQAYVLSRERFLEVVERRPRLGARLSLSLLGTVGERLRDLTDRLALTEALLYESPAETASILAAVRGELLPR